MSKLINPEFIGDEFIADIPTKKPSVLTYIYNAVSKIVNPSIPVTVHYLSDNGSYSDTAKSEIKKRLSDINASISYITGKAAPKTIYYDTPAQDWRAGAFDLAQLSRDTIRGAGNIIFLNCAPRRKEREKEKDNGGEKVFIGMLRNGTVISAVSEDSFILFRDLIEEGDLEIYSANVQIKGSQFRSRDYFPWLSQLIAFNLSTNATNWRPDMDVEERRALLETLKFVDTTQTLSAEQVVDIKQEPCVLRADCHGNLKLSLRRKELEEIAPGTAITIELGGKSFDCVLKTNMFDPSNGKSKIGMAFGSSGHWSDSKEGPFVELALMGKSIRDELGISDQMLKEGVLVNITAANDNLVTAPETPAAKGIAATHS